VFSETVPGIVGSSLTLNCNYGSSSLTNMHWRRIQVGMLERSLSIGSAVQLGYTSLYSVVTSTANVYKLTIKSVSSDDYKYAYMCYDDLAKAYYYFGQVTSGSSNSRNFYIIS
jgi:hypothetical protein